MTARGVVAGVALLVAATACGGGADGGDGGDLAFWSVREGVEVGPDDTEVPVSVTRAGCNNGETGRVLAPEIDVTDTAVTVTYRVEPQSGDASCPSNDRVDVVLVLPEPLGDRRLVDAGCSETDRLECER